MPLRLKPGDEDAKITVEIQNIGDGDAECVKSRLTLPAGFNASDSYSDIANLGTVAADAILQADGGRNGAYNDCRVHTGLCCGVTLLQVGTYRSALVGLIALTPIVLALVWTISTMRLIDLPFTGLSVTIFTMVMGIGIDYSIHLVHRIKEERKSHKIEDAVVIAVTNVGDSLFSATATATTTVCFASLTLASLLAVDRLGRTLSLGVIFCSLPRSLWFPRLAIEERVREWRGRGTTD